MICWHAHDDIKYHLQINLLVNNCFKFWEKSLLTDPSILYLCWERITSVRMHVFDPIYSTSNVFSARLLVGCYIVTSIPCFPFVIREKIMCNPHSVTIIIFHLAFLTWNWIIYHWKTKTVKWQINISYAHCVVPIVGLRNQELCLDWDIKMMWKLPLLLKCTTYTCYLISYTDLQFQVNLWNIMFI